MVEPVILKKFESVTLKSFYIVNLFGSLFITVSLKLPKIKLGLGSTTSKLPTMNLQLHYLFNARPKHFQYGIYLELGLFFKPMPQVNTRVVPTLTTPTTYGKDF